MLNNNLNLKRINLDSQDQATPQQPINNQYTAPKTTTMSNKILPFLIVVILGVGTGFIGHSLFPWNAGANGQSANNMTGDAAGLKVGDVIGIDDENANDEAVGVIQAGGFEGEGSHHLLRPGGADQTVYLTSSVVDLDQFVGHKVTIWGETFSAQKAGWLMDITKVKLEELNAQTPQE